MEGSAPLATMDRFSEDDWTASTPEQGPACRACSELPVENFVSACETTGLHHLLEMPFPVTVFAPCDAAFRALPGSLRLRLGERDGPSLLRGILASHIVLDEVVLEARHDELLLPLSEVPIPVEYDGDDIWIGNARVLGGPCKADNGRIYLIDRVLTPQRR